MLDALDAMSWRSRMKQSQGAMHLVVRRCGSHTILATVVYVVLHMETFFQQRGAQHNK